METALDGEAGPPGRKPYRKAIPPFNPRKLRPLD